jgi:5-methylcytosine-specific restriction enzyme A
MPRSIPSGLTAEHVQLALADIDSGVDHPFGLPTGYELVHEGRQYPPKAVIGLAFRHFKGQILPPEDFSDGGRGIGGKPRLFELPSSMNT